jgi:hypothetical protein
LPEEIKAGIPKPQLTDEEKAALHNVTSALYNRKEVKSVVESAVEAVCKAIGVAVPEKKEKNKGKKKSEGDDRPQESSNHAEGDKGSAKDRSPEEGRLKEKKKRKGSESAKAGEGEEENEEEEKAISQLDALLGLASDTEDDEEEEEVLQKGPTRRSTAAKTELDPMEITTDEEGDESDAEDEDGTDEENEFEGFSDSDQSNQKQSPSDDESVDASDDESSASSIDRSPPPKKAATSKRGAKTKPGDSTFLPTLMGGYISGSESAEDIDDIRPRKNRRGQRARQAIWEKKYKDKAKHLQKQASQGRDAGWDPKRGAVDGDAKPWKRGIRNPLLEKSKGPEPAQAPPKKDPPKRTRDDSGPLHPSWEAKRMAKEKLTAPFQGKKITFD